MGGGDVTSSSSVLVAFDNFVVNAGTPVFPPPPCVGSIIDSSLSNDQIDVSLTGGCDGVLTIRNKKNYWTNFKISTTGSATATPIGGSSNPYAAAGLLPPSGLIGSSTAVMYDIHFSNKHESITIYVDPTGQTGNGNARWMNFVQVCLNAIPFGSAVQLLIDDQ